MTEYLDRNSEGDLPDILRIKDRAARGHRTETQVASVLAAAYIIVVDVHQTQTQRLMFLRCFYCKNKVCFNLCKCYATSMERTSFFGIIGINCPQAVVSTELMKFAVLYWFLYEISYQRVAV